MPTITADTLPTEDASGIDAERGECTTTNPWTVETPVSPKANLVGWLVGRFGLKKVVVFFVLGAAVLSLLIGGVTVAVNRNKVGSTACPAGSHHSALRLDPNIYSKAVREAQAKYDARQCILDN